MADEDFTPHELLNDFKRRMKIYHKSEDQELSRSLTASQARIRQITGSEDLKDPLIAELIMERSRYAYNDQLEFFEQNFLSDLLAASLQHYEPSDGGDDDGGTTPVPV